MNGSSQPRRDVEPWLRDGPAHYGNGPTALYCDFENLVLGAGSGLAGQTNPVPTKAVTWLCRWYGNASIRRAYANWADPRFGRHQAALCDNNIDLIHIPRLTRGAHKNAADIRLAVDAMETLMTHPEVGVFVLVTGDSDYTPLVGRLREYGKHVIGVGAQPNASTHLVQACSEYKFWATIVARVQPNTPPATQPGFRIADAEQLLIRAFEVLGGNVATPTASQVKGRMLALDPSFDEANYGCSAFRAFLSHLPHRVRTAGSSGGDITLALIDQPTGSVTEPGP
jgi:NYN domain-containing protein/OST-HTH/LOTUS domain-containing protein